MDSCIKTANPELVFQFFIAFARFEFALTSSGFFKLRKSRQEADPSEVKPDWDGFAASIRNNSDRGREEKLRKACDYLLDLSPPWRQVVVDNEIEWDATTPCENLPEIDRLLISVRRVRNNLFHGATFSTIPIGDMGRNATLLESSLIVLEECLSLSPRIRRWYEDAIL